MTELFLGIIVGMFIIGGIAQILPFYVHKLMSNWRKKRKAYTFKVTMENGDTHYHHGGRAAKYRWEHTPGAHVDILKEFN